MHLSFSPDASRFSFSSSWNASARFSRASATPTDTPVIEPEGGGVELGRLDRLEGRVDRLLERLRNVGEDVEFDPERGEGHGHGGHGGTRRLLGRIDHAVRHGVRELASSLELEGADKDAVKSLLRDFRDEIRSVRDDGLSPEELAGETEGSFDRLVSGLRAALGEPAGGGDGAPQPGDATPSAVVDVRVRPVRPNATGGGTPPVEELATATAPLGGGADAPTAPAPAPATTEPTQRFDSLVESFRELLGELRELLASPGTSGSIEIGLSLYAEFGLDTTPGSVIDRTS